MCSRLKTAEVSVLHSASYDSQLHYSCVFKADDCRVTAELAVLHTERYDSQLAAMQLSGLFTDGAWHLKEL